MNKQEHNIQSECITWFRAYIKDGVMFAVPNAGQRTYAQLRFLMDEGFLAGAPDTVVVLPNGKILLIEFKTETGRQSKEQVELQKKIDNIDDEIYWVVRSKEDFTTVIEYMMK